MPPAEALPTPPIRLLHDHVFVVADKEPEKQGLIIIPKTVKRKGDMELLSGVVARIGPGWLDKSGDRRRTHPDLKRGDHVLYNKYGVDTREVDGIEYAIVREESIYAVLEDE